MSGHAAAAPLSSVMNWRRLRSSMGSSPEPAVPAYRKLSMSRKRREVLGGDLNCSEPSPDRYCPASVSLKVRIEPTRRMKALSDTRSSAYNGELTSLMRKALRKPQSRRRERSKRSMDVLG